MIDWTQMVTAEASATAALDAAKAAARAELATAVGSLRGAYITSLPGQEMIYMAKEAEARDWLAAGEPADLTTYPLLVAEIGLTAPTAFELAQLWLNMGALWREAAARLETLRLGAGTAIEAAETVEQVEAALKLFD